MITDCMYIKFLPADFQEAIALSFFLFSFLNWLTKTFHSICCLKGETDDLLMIVDYYHPIIGQTPLQY